MKFQLCLNLIFATLACVHAIPVISPNEIAVNSAQGLRLLSLEEGTEPVWKTEDEKLELMRASVNFFDVTEVYELEQKNGVVTSNGFAKVAATTFPAPSHQAALTPILNTVSTANMQTNLNSLTAFNNRYYKSTTGAQASTWILNTVKTITSSRSDITVSLYSHSWGQSSIIAKIAGTSASSPVTIVGAHMDSINLSNPTNGRAPGADDDGTGTVNLIEGLRVLVAAGFKPSTPVEFHWYSAEEAGLLGSQAIATAYKNAGTKVKAFMELDMSGYFKPGTKEVMALQADYIDEGLNTFLKALITMYSRIPWAMDIPCGYACSDHASWYKTGVPSSFPYEAITGDDDPSIHSASDTTSVSGFSWAHSLEFAKIGVAFVYEMPVAQKKRASAITCLTAIAVAIPPPVHSIPPRVVVLEDIYWTELCSRGTLNSQVVNLQAKAPDRFYVIWSILLNSSQSSSFLLLSYSHSPLIHVHQRPVVHVPRPSSQTGDGLTVRARIDPTLTVDDVVKQLCINLKIKEPPANFALRDETDELVTNDNLRKKIRAKVNLKLVNAPSREARETADKLIQRNDRNLKLTLFSLQKFIREEQFAQEFINHNGLAELVSVIYSTNGNTLAYALTAMQNLLELDYGWANLDDDFIFKIVQILSSPHSLINVCRPATAILKKLVEADPMSAPGPLLASSSKAPPSAPPGSVYQYGFHVVFEQMRKEKGLLETVVSRLGSADTAMAQYSMMLINSLLSHASDTRWEEFISELERLNVRKAVVRLMSLHIMEDLTSCILDFQANIIRVTYRKKTTLVDPDSEPAHAAVLDYIWESSRLDEETDESGQPLKWRKLGFDTEDMVQEFSEVGVLGLDCLKKLVEGDQDFSKLVLEQLSRPAERRCPIGKASNEVVELLSEHWAIFAPGYSTSTTFQPFFLDFYKVHSLATHFFLRMWNESGAASGDFTRVVALVRSQVKVALRSENVRPWHEVEHDFIEREYRSVRDRQMKELELEDDLLSKVPVRNLRAKLYKESYEFVRQQRIQCLFQGAWFVNALPQSSPRDIPRRPGRPWRFMRLDTGMKYLHYVDSAVKFPVRNGLEDLPERIDVSMISEIATVTCAPPPNVLRDQNDLPPTSPLIPSPLSFSLLSAHEGSLADQIAPDQSRWADWTDGLNMLRRDGGHVASKETAGFVQALTEIGLKIKLLDLSGEMVEIPSGLVPGPPPTNTDFFFSELI